MSITLVFFGDLYAVLLVSIIMVSVIVVKELATLTFFFSVTRSLPALISIIPVWTAVVRILLVLDIIRVNRGHLNDDPPPPPESWSLLRKILITAALSFSIAILSLTHRLNMVFFPRHSTSKCLTFLVVTNLRSVLIASHWSSQRWKHGCHLWLLCSPSH
jgi:hypothetical protein